MSNHPTPTGRLERGASGRDLILTRHFSAPIEDVWASITESERTSRWFASWEGDGAPGKEIRYTLVMEEGQPVGRMTIDACEAPHHLAVSSTDDYGTWRLEATLAQSADVTTLTFVHHLDDGLDVGDVGPGWEYYLDQLVASREGAARLEFDDYYPAQRDHYRALDAGLS